MLTLLTIVHFLVCILLIVIVLLQHGKGADMGASFGGGSGQTVFGTEGPVPMLNKITTAIAIIFMLTSATLAYYSTSASRNSVMKSMPVAPAARKVETAPTPVEVPMSDQGPKNGTAVPEKFPGAAPTVNENAAKQPEAEKSAPPPETKSAAKQPAAAPQDKPEKQPQGTKNQKK